MVCGGVSVRLYVRTSELNIFAVSFNLTSICSLRIENSFKMDSYVYPPIDNELVLSKMLRKPTSNVSFKTTNGSRTVSFASPCPDDDYPKPFAKISFYLDMTNVRYLKKMTNDITSLGGIVETFLSKEVNYVVTDRRGRNLHCKKGVFDDGSLPSTPNSLSNPKSGTNDSPCNVESPKEKNVPKRVSSRASAIMEKARKSVTKGSSDVLQIAHLWGVKVVSSARIYSTIKRIKLHQIHSTKDTNMLKLKSSSVHKTILVTPFVKFEDASRVYRPHYRQFREWPVLNLNADHARSPFVRVSLKREIQNDGTVQHKHVSLSVPSQETDSTKESSRSMKTTASVFTQPLNSSTCTENSNIDVIKPGFCETCATRYEDFYQHITTEEHEQFLRKPELYDALDKKIATLPDIFTCSIARCHSISSDFAATSKNQKRKEIFSRPMPASGKRKHQAGSSQTSSPNIRSIKPSKHTDTENLDTVKDVSWKRRTSNSRGSVPCKRKVLQELNVNCPEPVNSWTFQTQDLSNSQEAVSKKSENEEKPETIRVLRSTAMRRITACQSTKSASSPSFSSAVLSHWLECQKANSSPGELAFDKRKRRLFGVCRTLDLGDPSPAQQKRSRHDTIQKFQNDMPCLESVLNAPIPQALIDMSYVKCVTPVSPVRLESPLAPVTPTRDTESQFNQATACPETPDCNCISQTQDTSTVMQSANISCDYGCSNADDAEDHVWPLNDKDSKLQEINEILGEDFAQTAEMVRIGKNEELVSAISEAEMRNKITTADSLFKKDESDSSRISENDLVPASPKAIDLESSSSAKADSYLPTSPSLVFDRELSSPAPQRSVESTSSDSVIQRSEGDIPRDNAISEAEMRNNITTAENRIWPLNEKVSKVEEITEKLAEDFVQNAEVARVGKIEEPVSAISEAEMRNSYTTADSLFEKDEPDSSCISENDSVLFPSKTIDWKSSSVFKVISPSPVPQHSAKSTSTDSAIPQTVGGVPKLVLRLVRGDKNVQWHSSIVGDSTGAA